MAERWRPIPAGRCACAGCHCNRRTFSVADQQVAFTLPRVQQATSAPKPHRNYGRPVPFESEICRRRAGAGANSDSDTSQFSFLAVRRLSYSQRVSKRWLRTEVDRHASKLPADRCDILVRLLPGVRRPASGDIAQRHARSLAGDGGACRAGADHGCSRLAERSGGRADALRLALCRQRDRADDGEHDAAAYRPRRRRWRFLPSSRQRLASRRRRPAAAEVEPIEIPDAVVAIPSKAAPPVQPAEPQSPIGGAGRARDSGAAGSTPAAADDRRRHRSAVHTVGRDRAGRSAAGRHVQRPTSPKRRSRTQQTVERSETPKADAAANEPSTPPAVDTRSTCALAGADRHRCIGADVNSCGRPWRDRAAAGCGTGHGSGRAIDRCRRNRRPGREPQHARDGDDRTAETAAGRRRAAGHEQDRGQETRRPRSGATATRSATRSAMTRSAADSATGAAARYRLEPGSHAPVAARPLCENRFPLLGIML